MSKAGPLSRHGYAIEVLLTTRIWAAYVNLLRFPASAGPEPYVSAFAPINSSAGLENENRKPFSEDWSHGFSEKTPASSTPGKRKRAELSKAPRRPVSNIAKPRRPQRTGNSKSPRNQELLESQSKKKPLSSAPQILEHDVRSLPKSTSQEQDVPSQDANVDKIFDFDSNFQESFWPETESSDHNVDHFIPRECFEVTTLTADTQANGHLKNPRIEANRLPAREELNDNFTKKKEDQESQSQKTFLDYYPSENLLELEKYDGTSLDDGFTFDTLIDGFSWNGKASVVWGDDDDFAMNEDDVLDIMQLEEVEKVMTAAEGSVNAEKFDAAGVLPSLSTENACTIDSNPDDLWEVDSLFIESLQADLIESEPKENVTENGLLVISSPQLAQQSSPCSQHPNSVGGVHSKSLYDDEDLEQELLNLGASAFSSVEGPPSSTPPSSPVPISSPKPSTVEKPTPQPDVPHLISFDADGKPLPFIRQPFAKPVRDRPVIHALRTEPVLRTCFRIGEALNAASATSNSGIDSIIELYARVVSSTREQEPSSSSKQHFQFADLFTPDKPPFLTGLYTLWRGVELWDHGSRVFLGERGKGRMARVVGRMRKEEDGKGKGNWMMVVLCVWQVDWEEVGLAKGVVCS